MNISRSTTRQKSKRTKTPFRIIGRSDIPSSIEDEYNALCEWLQYLKEEEKFHLISKDNIKHWNIPCSFDIETSSWINEKGCKRATMYCFVFGVYGRVFVGRTWEDFNRFLEASVRILEVSSEKILTFYVHNLAYEFQWIRKLLDWESVFAIDSRQPVKATTKEGICFKCSYILSGYSLAKVGEHLAKYKVEKKVGDLDYRLIRHSKTPLTAKEWGYVYNDGLVVMAFIQEEIENNKGKITNIPLTKTGYVRRYMRDCCYQNHTEHKNHKYSHYRDKMLALTLCPKEYEMAHRAFQGGFTHANALYTNRTMEDVTSYDFTSSYPAVMIAEKFPMSKGIHVENPTEEDFKRIQKYYLSMFYVEWTNVQSKMLGDNPISLSKCMVHEGAVIDNGRVVRAKRIVMCITNIDYNVYKAFYEIKGERIKDVWYYEKQYLPTDFIKGLLKLYKDKTSLKGILEYVVEYMKSKNMLNACFGMAVTNIIRDEQVYEDGEWESKPCESIDEAIEKYNNSKSRFLSYLWGVWITAYARRNLFTAIYSIQNDYIYADTDSVKFVNYEAHKQYFEDYNDLEIKKLKKAMGFHGLPFEEVSPKTIKGVAKTIGVWDYDGHYTRFRTMGAKRYLVEHDDGSIGITISGVSKKCGVDYLKFKYKTNDSIFEHFTDSLVFPAEYMDNNEVKLGSGKNIHTYIDEKTNGIVTDYLGEKYHYFEESSIYMEATSYNLNVTDEYRDFFSGRQELSRGV